VGSNAAFGPLFDMGYIQYTFCLSLLFSIMQRCVFFAREVAARGNSNFIGYGIRQVHDEFEDAWGFASGDVSLGNVN
jgi:hypothetical protein